jgi:hypothetical protein
MACRVAKHLLKVWGANSTLAGNFISSLICFKNLKKVKRLALFGCHFLFRNSLTISGAI